MHINHLPTDILRIIFTYFPKKNREANFDAIDKVCRRWRSLWAELRVNWNNEHRCSIRYDRHATLKMTRKWGPRITFLSFLVEHNSCWHRSLILAKCSNLVELRLNFQNRLDFLKASPTTLKKLIISETKFFKYEKLGEYIPTTLTKLSLIDCRNTGDLDFLNTRLISLSLRSSNLSTQAIAKLSLRKLKLQGTHDIPLELPPTLTKLSFKLDFLPPPYPLNLKTLFLRYNSFQKIDLRDFPFNPHLNTLKVCSQFLGKLILPPLTNSITYLNLKNIEFPGNVQFPVSLRVLKIVSCIIPFQKGSLMLPANLKELNITNISISLILPQNLETLIISISRNAFQEFALPPVLRYLKMDDVQLANKLTTLPHTLEQFTLTKGTYCPSAEVQNLLNANMTQCELTRGTWLKKNS